MPGDVIYLAVSVLCTLKISYVKLLNYAGGHWQHCIFILV